MPTPPHERNSDAAHRSSIEVLIENLDSLQVFARVLAKVAKAPCIFGLNGTLGAGKTQLVRSFVESIGGDSFDVTSPTYVLVHRYETEPKVFHLDTYRIQDEDELLDIGFEEILESGAIVFIEWANRFPDTLPKDRFDLQIDVLDEHRRVISIAARGKRCQELLGR